MNMAKAKGRDEPLRKYKDRHATGDDYRVLTPQLPSGSTDGRILTGQQLNSLKQNKRRANERAALKKNAAAVEVTESSKRLKVTADSATTQPNRLFGAVEEWFARKRAREAELRGEENNGAATKALGVVGNGLHEAGVSCRAALVRLESLLGTRERCASALG